MLALAYLELEMLAEAALLNKRLKSDELSRKLDEGYQRQSASLSERKKISEAQQALELINRGRGETNFTCIYRSNNDHQ